MCGGSEHSEGFPGEKITSVCRSEYSEKDVSREDQKCVRFRTQCRSLWREHKLSVCMCVCVYFRISWREDNKWVVQKTVKGCVERRSEVCMFQNTM